MGVFFVVYLIPMISIPEQQLREILVNEGILTAEQFDDFAMSASRLGQRVSDILMSKNVITPQYYNNLVAGYFNVEFASLGTRGIDANVFRLLPESLARQKRTILFGKEFDGRLSVAMEDPTDLVVIGFLETYLKAKIKSYLASTDDLNRGFAMYGKASAEDYKKIIEANVAASLESKAKGEAAAGELPIVEIINNILSYALSLRASDIHMEIFEDTVIVRYRIDGILHEILQIPKSVYPAIVARIKILGAMKIDEHQKPQDGRFRYQVGADVVDMRVSILPTFYGEKVEMRILTGAAKPISLTELGMLPETISIVEENISKSYGMVIVSGPTGSGKSTTLYSILSMLNRPEVNIVTVEDPVEYDMKYVNQTQVNAQAGTTFASGLRAILRQDPNIIMVGETRDPETADISVQAALTGHMVLTSLHTNDAPTSVPRLFDLNVPPFLVSSVLNLILAQRLVRKVCKSCIYSYEPAPEIVKIVKDQASAVGIPAFKVPDLFYAGKGCNVCGGTGHVGRMGIYEALNVTQNVRAFIIDPKFSLDGLRAIARKEGMVSMFEDGMKKIERGMTTIDELLRVIRE